MDAAAITAFDIAMVTAALFSLATLFYLFQKHIAGRSLLAYQARYRVPWGSLVALLAMSMPVLALVAFFSNLVRGEQTTTAEAITIQDFMLMGSFDTVFKILFVFSMMIWLRTFFRANAHDLGLPTSWKQLRRDVGIGTIACIAALLPINFLQIFLINAFDSKTLHPLVEQLQENHSPAILMLSFCMVVIVAPLFEEFTFRGLLQGWLERCEDEALAYTATERRPAAPDGALDIIGDDSNLRLAPEYVSALRPTHGWIRELPHGWAPILLSGFAFGLAHLGHGVAPIPLVLFGIVLGYLYQRTHRLVPSITAHMLFNAYSMLLLWLQLKAPMTG